MPFVLYELSSDPLRSQSANVNGKTEQMCITVNRNDLCIHLKKEFKNQKDCNWFVFHICAIYHLDRLSWIRICSIENADSANKFQYWNIVMSTERVNLDFIMYC